MAREFAKKFYKSKTWRACRESYISKRIQIDGGLCEKCKDNVGYILHHKITLTPSNISDPDIALNHCNLMYVCKECHDEFEGHGLNKKEKCICMFDENGQPIPR
ncbi:hypothetical protein ACTQ6A_13905 [Lachnospiraceae bacterium LCP25S3_G4]